MCSFKSGWKLNANKALFLCVVIYHCAEEQRRGRRCIERNDSPHILEKQLDNKARGGRKKKEKEK